MEDKLYNQYTQEDIDKILGALDKEGVDYTPRLRVFNLRTGEEMALELTKDNPDFNKLTMSTGVKVIDTENIPLKHSIITNVIP